MRDRKKSYLWGIIAEYLCMGLLLIKGYTLLAWRVRNPQGEIDIVAVRANTVAFIEVKARANANDALLSITPAKQQRLLKAAHAYIVHKGKYAQHDLRFDVMVVTSPWNIIHLKDAWRA